MKKLIIAATTCCILAVFALISCNKNAELKNLVSNLSKEEFSSKTEAEKVKILDQDKDYIFVNQKSKLAVAKLITSGVELSKIDFNNEADLLKVFHQSKAEFEAERTLIREAAMRIVERYKLQSEIADNCMACKVAKKESSIYGDNLIKDVRQDKVAMDKWHKVLNNQANLGDKTTRSAAEESIGDESDAAAGLLCRLCKAACNLLSNNVQVHLCLAACYVTVCD